jgi:FAD-dependent urate hydroxylase
MAIPAPVSFQQVKTDLEKIQSPPPIWERNSKIEDVAIIGGGMAGLTTAFALRKWGITNVQIFEAKKSGQAGPWKTTARMNTLRSTKFEMGPALGVPSLTFHSWVEQTLGPSAWEAMGKASTVNWSDYLQWYKEVLSLKVNYESSLEKMAPQTFENRSVVELTFKTPEGIKVLTFRKVVLATGRDGCGGPQIPEFLKSIPKKFWFHTHEVFDFKKLKGKHVIIIGCGASGFDAAAEALEKGAKDVQMLVRRATLPTINLFGTLSYRFHQNGYYALPDQERLDLMGKAFDIGIPPPKESLDRLKGYSNFRVRFNIDIKEGRSNGKLVLETTSENIPCDILIAATGFKVDLSAQKELASLADKVLLWGDRNVVFGRTPSHEKLKLFPYLGRHFQFLSKTEQEDPFISNIHCFNYAAFLSHCTISGDIPGISIGAERLAQGLAEELFLKEKQDFFDLAANFNRPTFDASTYAFLSPTKNK